MSRGHCLGNSRFFVKIIKNRLKLFEASRSVGITLWKGALTPITHETDLCTTDDYLYRVNLTNNSNL
jgi:hypothetical protein